MNLTICRRIILVTFVTGIFFSVTASAQADPPYKITGMKVMTYNQYTGAFSKDISEEKDNEFWNALGLSVFIAVEVTGKRDSYVSGRKIEVTVYEGKKIVLKRIEGVGYIRDSKKYVPAYIYSSLCQPLTITARITGQSKVSTITKKLNFACGE